MSRELRHLSQNKFALGRSVKRATCTEFAAKRRNTLYFLQQRFVTCNNLEKRKSLPAAHTLTACSECQKS